MIAAWNRVAPKARYLATAAIRTVTGATPSCPSCGNDSSSFVARKYVVTQLRRCTGCHLLFRTPTWRPDTSEAFYERSYTQGFTTDLPDDVALASLLTSKFHHSEKDYRPYLGVLDALGVKAGSRVFDFGCSWGYGTWQLRDRGLNVDAFEISPERAAFARHKLGLTVFDRLPSTTTCYDVFFSAHVLEHVPSVAESMSYGLSVLKRGGLFVAFTPNASDPFRRARPRAWMRAWGLVHPNFLDDEYYERAWGRLPHLVATHPYPLEALRRWSVDRRQSVVCDLSGPELLFVTARD